MSNIKTLAFAAALLLLGCAEDFQRDNPNDYVNRAGDLPSYENSSSSNGNSSPSGGGSYTVVYGKWDVVSGNGSTISASQQDAGSNTVSSSITVSGTISKSAGDDNAWASWLISNNVVASQLKTATSISFKVRGDGQKYQLQVPTRDIRDDANYGYYYTTFATTNGTEQTVTVNISDLRQPSWAAPAAFNRDKIISIDWQANGNDGITGAFSITISDIRIYSN